MWVADAMSFELSLRFPRVLQDFKSSGWQQGENVLRSALFLLKAESLHFLIFCKFTVDHLARADRKSVV